MSNETSGLSTKPRDSFTSSIGMIAATLGSAVGLGNIWKFPAMTGEHGGASFLLVYILCTLVVGLPIMIAEIMIGRKAKANAITTYTKLAPKGQKWGLIGVSGVIAAFLILAFYTGVAGWVFAYVIKGLTGEVLSSNPEVTGKAFVDLISSPVQSLFWQWFVIIFVCTIISFGVSKGIERTTTRLMPVLLLLLVVVCVRSLTLEGASQGLKFLFTPDFSKINGTVILMAMGLSFFKLSVGMGTMTTYGSYFKDDQNIPSTAFRVMLADLSVSMLAGIAIFPAVFSFGFDPSGGPALLFITIPAVFSSMPFGGVFAVLFFVLAAVATTGAMLSLFEVPVAYLCENHGLSRKKGAAIAGVVTAAFGSLAALSNSTLADVKIFGKTFFDIYDFLSSNVALPLGGLAICLFAAHIFGPKLIEDNLTNNGKLNMPMVVKGFTFLVKYVTPILVAVILLRGLGVF